MKRNDRPNRLQSDLTADDLALLRRSTCLSAPVAFNTSAAGAANLASARAIIPTLSAAALLNIVNTSSTPAAVDLARAELAKRGEPATAGTSTPPPTVAPQNVDAIKTLLASFNDAALRVEATSSKHAWVREHACSLLAERARARGNNVQANHPPALRITSGGVSHTFSYADWKAAKAQARTEWDAMTPGQKQKWKGDLAFVDARAKELMKR